MYIMSQRHTDGWQANKAASEGLQALNEVERLTAENKTIKTENATLVEVAALL